MCGVEAVIRDTLDTLITPASIVFYKNVNSCYTLLVIYRLISALIRRMATPTRPLPESIPI